jgi:hypothetical protein
MYNGVRALHRTKKENRQDSENQHHSQFASSALEIMGESTARLLALPIAIAPPCRA